MRPILLLGSDRWSHSLWRLPRLLKSHPTPCQTARPCGSNLGFWGPYLRRKIEARWIILAHPGSALWDELWPSPLSRVSPAQASPSAGTHCHWARRRVHSPTLFYRSALVFLRPAAGGKRRRESGPVRVVGAAVGLGGAAADPWSDCRRRGRHLLHYRTCAHHCTDNIHCCSPFTAATFNCAATSYLALLLLSFELINILFLDIQVL